MQEGTVRYSYYKNGGVWRKPGLRNKRNAHWAKIRKAELDEKIRRAKAAERSNAEWDQQFDNYSGY